MERQTSAQDMVAVAIGFGLIVAISLFFLFKGSGDTNSVGSGITPDNESEKAASLPTMSVLEMRDALLRSESMLVVLDLRSPESYRAAHAAGSLSISTVSDIASVAVPDEGRLLLVPTGDAASDRAASESVRATGKRYSFMANGLAGWQAAGGAIVTEPDVASPIDRSKVTLIKSDAWKEMIAKKDIPYRILDVRSADESSRSPVSGAQNIPYDDLEERRADIPYASNIALCGSSVDAAFRGAVRLFDLGFFSVRTLDGNCSDIR